MRDAVDAGQAVPSADELIVEFDLLRERPAFTDEISAATESPDAPAVEARRNSKW